MAHNFSNNKKVKVIAAAIADNMDYLKRAKSYMTQAEREGKKYGKKYDIYIPDPGKVIDGIVADPDSITEVKMTVEMDAKNTSVELDAWDKMENIEDFTKEIAVPRATKLAKSVQKDAIEKTIFDAAQVTVADNANFAALSDASMALDEVAVAGSKVTFLAPTQMGKIAAGGLANFIPDSIQKDIYGKNYLGEYAGASTVSLDGLPVIEASDSTLSLSPVDVEDEDGNWVGFEEITTGTCTTACKPGDVFSTNLKIVGVDGMEKDQDFTIVVKSVSGTTATFAPVRVSLEGKDTGNPNAWMPASGAITCTNALASGQKYAVGVVRQEDAIAFDSYKFSNLPGSENSFETVDSVSVKMSQYGNGMTESSLVKLLVPYAVGTPDSRYQSLIYVKK